MSAAAKAATAQDAIADLLEVPMVTRWVVVAETIDANGERCLADITSPGLAYWDATGMLIAAAQGRAAQPMWSLADDDE